LAKQRNSARLVKIVATQLFVSAKRLGEMTWTKKLSSLLEVAVALE
jgi:hypothetical protein